MELVVDRTDVIDGAIAHTVHTVARIGGGTPGLMVASSTFRSANWLSGFKAAVVVVLLDANNRVIARSDPPQHGWADFTWLGGASHERTQIWTYQFDTGTADGAAGIGVLHFPDENYLSNISGFFDRFGGLIGDLLKNLQGGSGETPRPFDPTTQSGGGGGGLGGPEETSWALMASPWNGFARTEARAVGHATATPNAFQHHVPANITVHAVDSATNAPISGSVYVGEAAVGATDTQFTYTWNRTYIMHVDPRTHQRSYTLTPLEPMTVRANGYDPIPVSYTVTPPTSISF